MGVGDAPFHAPRLDAIRERMVSPGCIRVNQQGNRPDPPSEDDALREIVQGAEAETGERFFPSLVRHLASALAVQYAFVSELLPDRQRFRTRAGWGRGGVLDTLW